jgi:hypothetical protein
MCTIKIECVLGPGKLNDGRLDTIYDSTRSSVIRKTLCLLIGAFCAFQKQKKQIIEKHCLLGKSNPFYFSYTFFFFTIPTYFLYELACIHLLVINQLYFLYFL